MEGRNHMKVKSLYSDWKRVKCKYRDMKEEKKRIGDIVNGRKSDQEISLEDNGKTKWLCHKTENVEGSRSWG